MSQLARELPQIGSGWEPSFYNRARGYTYYRFQDFKSGCPMLADGEHAETCTHPKHPWQADDHPACFCDLCPCVQIRLEDDETNWSEGQQPIEVLSWGEQTTTIELEGKRVAAEDLL